MTLLCLNVILGTSITVSFFKRMYYCWHFIKRSRIEFPQKWDITDFGYFCHFYIWRTFAKVRWFYSSLTELWDMCRRITCYFSISERTQWSCDLSFVLNFFSVMSFSIITFDIFCILHLLHLTSFCAISWWSILINVRFRELTSK